MGNFFEWDPSDFSRQYQYTITSGYMPNNIVYTFNVADGSISIGPDLEAIYDKADKEFDAMEDQTSIAKQLLNDIGINWNDKE